MTSFVAFIYGGPVFRACVNRLQRLESFLVFPMLQRLCLAAAPLLLSLTCFSTPAAAQTDFDLVGRAMGRILQNGHYSRPAFDVELSQKFLDEYLETLSGMSLEAQRTRFPSKMVFAARCSPKEVPPQLTSTAKWMLRPDRSIS